jgi:uncharacterized protein (DUF488 family)
VTADPDVPVLLTIGHGTRPLDELLDTLREARVSVLVDVRTVPRSGRNPQFSSESLRAVAEAAGLRYGWEKDLGGFRRPRPDSPHVAIRNESFRGYADHMGSQAFLEALERLMGTARHEPTAVMCAETVWWRCHRRMIADALAAQGWAVRHLLGPGRSEPHRLHPNARVEGGRIVYDAGVQQALA